MSDDIHAAMVYCKELRLPGLRWAYASLAREAVDNDYTLTRFLVVCLEEERQSRQQSRLQTYTRQAKFPSLKTLQDFDFTAIPSLSKPKILSLAEANFVRDSLLITTNLEFGRWDEVSHDTTMTTTLLDRLTHHSHILVFEGESYRFRESQRRNGIDRGTA